MINFKFVPSNVKHPLDFFRWIMRDVRIKKNRSQLHNKDFSIIASNCLGALISHDYLQPLLSPTVNLFMYPKDYLRFLSNLDECLSADLKEKDSNYSYPVGDLLGCEIHFMHYHSFSEAKQKWNERSKRINLDNMLVIMVERDGCTMEDLCTFDNLPFKNKVVVVHKPYQNIKSSVVIPGFDSCNEVGIITNWSGLFGKRVYDSIDWVSILNSMLVN